MIYRSSSYIKFLLLYFVLVVGAAITIFPVVWTFLNSIKPASLTFTIPPRLLFTPTIDSYKALFTGGYEAVAIWPYMKNSLIVSIISTFLTLGVSILAAYSLSRFNFKGKAILTLGIVATRMLPPVGTIIPMYILMSKLGLLDTHLSLILAYTALNIPLAVMMLRGFLDEIPSELEEAATIDGCSRLHALAVILVPLILPGVVATSIFSFLLSWNEFAIAIMLTSRKALTLPLIAMQFRAEEGIAWGPMSAASTLALIFPIVFVLLTQRHMVRGLVAGAVKG